MNKRRQYHKSNCDSTVRAIVTDALGRKVILVGKHAFEWSIILEKEGRLVITTFPITKSTGINDMCTYPVYEVIHNFLI